MRRRRMRSKKRDEQPDYRLRKTTPAGSASNVSPRASILSPVADAAAAIWTGVPASRASIQRTSGAARTPMHARPQPCATRMISPDEAAIAAGDIGAGGIACDVDRLNRPRPMAGGCSETSAPRLRSCKPKPAANAMTDERRDSFHPPRDYDATTKPIPRHRQYRQQRQATSKPGCAVTSRRLRPGERFPPTKGFRAYV
jgi:hypothetical protein